VIFKKLIYANLQCHHLITSYFFFFKLYTFHTILIYFQQMKNRPEMSFVVVHKYSFMTYYGLVQILLFYYSVACTLYTFQYLK